MFTKQALIENLIDPAWTEKTLSNYRDAAFPRITRRVKDALDKKTDAILADAGFPKSTRERTVTVELDENNANVYAQHYDIIDLPSLSTVDPKLRSSVIASLYKSGAPVITALDLFELSYGWSEAMHLLPIHPNPTDAELKAVWKELHETLDGELVDDETEADGGASYVYGIGSCEDFVSVSQMLCTAALRWKAKPKRCGFRATKRWTQKRDQLEKIGTILSDWQFHEHGERDEMRDMSESMILAIHPDDHRLAQLYFDLTNDGAGEIPGMCFDYRDDKAMLRATLYSKLPGAFMSFMSHGEPS